MPVRDIVTTTNPLPAKLTPPKHHNIIKRVRLFNVLDNALNKPLVWVGAVAGSGKTALVSSYLASCDLMPVWYQFDIRDADPAVFFFYLRQAVAYHASQRVPTLPLLTPEYVLGLDVFARNFFEEMFSLLPERISIVFDNAQEVSEISPLYTLFCSMGEMIPEGRSVIFISRSEVPAVFARFRASRQIEAVGSNALKLTLEESRTLVGCYLSGDVSDATIENVQQRTDGWMAGLILLLEAGDVASITNNVVDEHLFDYFAAEVFNRVDPLSRDIMLRVAVLPVLDVEVVAKLVGRDGVEALFSGLEKKNYFIHRKDGYGAVYEYHPLFRGFLLTELTHYLGSEELQDLRRAAGMLMASRGNLDAAVELLHVAEATAELLNVVLDNAEQIASYGMLNTLKAWLNLLGDESKTHSPWLEYWYGVSESVSNPLVSRRHFIGAYHGFVLANDARGAVMSWAGIAESFVLMWDDFGEMKHWLKEYENRKSLFAEISSEDLRGRFQAALFGVMLYLNPQHPECGESLKSLEGLLATDARPDFRVSVASKLAIYYSWSGEFEKLRRILEIGDIIKSSDEITPLSGILLDAAHSMCSWLVGDLEEAKRSARCGIKSGRDSGVHLVDSFLYAQEIYAAGICGDIPAMNEALHKMYLLMSPHRRLDVSHYYFLKGWISLLSTDKAAAIGYFRTSVETAEMLSAQVPLALMRLGLARALIENGESEESSRLFGLVLEFSREFGSRHLEYTARMIMAYAYLMRGKEQECVGELSAAFNLATGRTTYVTFPLWDTQMVSRLCGIAMKYDVNIDYAYILINKWKLPIPSGMTSTDSWPVIVEIYALGSYSLKINGKEMTALTRSRSKVDAMLKQIVCLGGRDVSVTKLCDVLWPDAEGDYSQQNFKVTLHRLRKLIGAGAIVLGGGRLSLNPEKVWLDSWDLESRLKTLKSKHNINEIAELLQHLIRDFGGVFNSQDIHSEMCAIREKLHAKFQQAIIDWAQVMFEQGDIDEAIACYSKAIEHEPNVEAFHEGLMACYCRLGKLTEAQHAYQRWQSVISNAHGSAPSAKMRRTIECLNGLET